MFVTKNENTEVKKDNTMGFTKQQRYEYDQLMKSGKKEYPDTHPGVLDLIVRAYILNNHNLDIFEQENNELRQELGEPSPKKNITINKSQNEISQTETD
jgi:hypothetical protein